MKFESVLVLVLGCFAQLSSAHYIFATLLTSSGSSTAAVRKAVENAPIKDITSKDATCNVNLTPATETVSVAAGSQIGLKLGEGKTVFHKGPAAMYLGKAPGTAAEWDGSGQNWFKISEWGATFDPFNFESFGMDTFTATIPKDVPSGEYLVRMEQMGLHIPGSAELFVGCAQIKVTGGGSGNPSKVSIPGYLQNDDPELTVNIFYPVPTAYTVPGPAVYKGGSSGPAAPVDPPSKPSAPVSKPSTTGAASVATSSAPAPSAVSGQLQPVVSPSAPSTPSNGTQTPPKSCSKRRRSSTGTSRVRRGVHWHQQHRRLSQY